METQTDATAPTAEAQAQASAPEPAEVQVHIRMPNDAYQRLKKCADYAVAEGLIAGHHLGNVTAYLDFCVRLGEEALYRRELKARGVG